MWSILLHLTVRQACVTNNIVIRSLLGPNWELAGLGRNTRTLTQKPVWRQVPGTFMTTIVSHCQRDSYWIMLEIKPGVLHRNVEKMLHDETPQLMHSLQSVTPFSSNMKLTFSRYVHTNPPHIWWVQLLTLSTALQPLFTFFISLNNKVTGQSNSLHNNIKCDIFLT